MVTNPKERHGPGAEAAAGGGRSTRQRERQRSGRTVVRLGEGRTGPKRIVRSSEDEETPRYVFRAPQRMPSADDVRVSQADKERKHAKHVAAGRRGGRRARDMHGEEYRRQYSQWVDGKRAAAVSDEDKDQHVGD